MLDLLAAMAAGFAVFSGTCVVQIVIGTTPFRIAAISLVQLLLIEAITRVASHHLSLEALLLYFFLILAWFLNILTGVSVIQKNSN